MSDDVAKMKQRLAELDVQIRKMEPDAHTQALVTVVGALTQMIDEFAAEIGGIKQRLSLFEENAGLAEPPTN